MNRFEKPKVAIEYHSDTAYHERCVKFSKILEEPFILMESKVLL